MTDATAKEQDLLTESPVLDVASCRKTQQKISAGISHSLVLKSDGTVVA